MIKTVLSALLFSAVLCASPANAVDNEAVMRCILREILASVTCKSVDEFRLVGKRDEVYVFNTHYAAKFTEFYCQVFDKDVIITCKAWQGNMASARLRFESQPGCISATVNSPWAECHAPKIVQCCGSD
ncbi:hypothetical protein [Fundidesulfovibrio terrae]|uniref:hypothetical protein n=1 Tax=Fundidesulfovibrio terrae TaxID=2922866 RepID=UPI001FAFD4CD|nr:hypothetical protein [Fundidesulfovibrio terrae]